MSKKFKRLLVPEGYRHYWSKYPEGYTILEALLNWVDSVNQLTDNVNDWNIYLDDFVENFDEKLRPTVREMLNEMEQDGRLSVIINEEIFSWKADKTYVDDELDKKSDLTYVDDELDKKSNRIDLLNTQLTQTGEQMNRELISKRNRRPMITIIDDDGRDDVLSNWEPILQEKDFKLDLGVITSYVGNTGYLDWPELERLKSDYNVDLVNHTHTHPYLANKTESQIHSEMQNSTKILQSRGHTWDIMVYPYGSVDKKVRDITRQYCRTGIYIHGGVNTPPLETYNLSRFNFMRIDEDDMEDISHYTEQIDEAIANNGWIIFVSHAFYNSFNANKVKAVIDYANARDIEWVHTKEGLDNIGNLIDVGDYVEGKEYTVLDADGKMHSKANSRDFQRLNPNSVNSNTHLYDFPWDVMSVVTISTATATGFPEDKAGTLITYHASGDANRPYSFQQYILYDSNKMYTRTWDRNSDSWGEFVEILTSESLLHHVDGTVNVYNADTLITEYPRGVTTFEVNTNGATGFPDNTAGLVTTYRVYGIVGWSRQEYRKYMSNEVWSRYVDGDENWTEWEKISVV